MAVRDDYLLSFNRGVISELVQNRADVKRVGMSAATQMNCIPRVMGPMSLRPGLEYIGEIATANGVVRMLPFVFSNNDKALVEITDEYVRVWEMDGLVTRQATLSTLANQEFTSNLNSWVDADDPANGLAVSSWNASGYMSLVGAGTHAAARYQPVALEFNEIGTGKEYAVNIGVVSGKVGFRIGSTVGADDIFTETTLGPGTHSLAFTPPGAGACLYFFNYSQREALVDFCRLNTTETPMAYNVNLLPTETLDDVRYVQSGDVIFIARGKAYPPAKIERRGRHSWSVTTYDAEDGPFRAANITETSITPSAVAGAVTLTASAPIFTSGNVGSLYKLQSAGVVTTVTLNGLGTATDIVKVTGVGSERDFDYSIATGVWSGAIVLEKSYQEDGRWTTVATYTSGSTVTGYNDTLDNQTVYYRLRVTVAVSGAAPAGTIEYILGSRTGVVKVEGFTSATVVTGKVIKTLGSTAATKDWAEGAWSPRRGYPSAVTFYQGRLWWAGKDRIWASVVDNYYSFDEDTVGDSGPIQRSIGTGTVDTISWLCPLRQLMVGAEGAEYMCRTTTIEDPITPTNFNLIRVGDYGASTTDVISVEGAAIYVDRTGARILALSNGEDSAEVLETSLLTPELCRPSIKRVAVQRRPDTRIHFVRCDGTAVVLIYDKAEQVNCFVTVETQGLIEDVVVVPNTPDDWVFYVVVRVIDGVARRYLERWANVDEAVGGERNKMLDSFFTYIGEPTKHIYGLDHLEGREVMVWGNAKYLGSFGVVLGHIALPENVSYAVVGLYYYGLYVSRKLGFLTQGPAALASRRRVVRAALMLQNTHKDALQYGSDEDHLDYLPPMSAEAAVADDYVHTTFDEDPVPFNGSISNSTEIVIKMHAPYPCTVTAAVVTLEAV